MLTETAWMGVVEELRADLELMRGAAATVTAERDNARSNWENVLHEHARRGLQINSLERALAETKAALVENRKDYLAAFGEMARAQEALEASRAERAAAQARIEQLEDGPALLRSANARIAELESMIHNMRQVLKP